MRNCFVPGCDQKHKHLPKRAMFNVPKKPILFAKWQEALPKLRPLKSDDRVCALHFQPNDVQRYFEHMIGGKRYQLERDRPRLNANVVPSLNMPNEEDLKLRKHCSKPKRLKRHETAEKKEGSEIVSEIDVQMLPEVKLLGAQDGVFEEYLQENSGELRLIETDLTEGSAEKEPLGMDLMENIVDRYDVFSPIDTHQMSTEEMNLDNLFNRFYNEVNDVQLPSTLWGIHRCPQRSIIYFSYMDMDKMRVTKMLTVDCHGVIKIFLADRLVQAINMITEVVTINTLSELLTQIDETRVCNGAFCSDTCELQLEDWKEGEEQSELCNTCINNGLEHIIESETV